MKQYAVTLLLGVVIGFTIGSIYTQHLIMLPSSAPIASYKANMTALHCQPSKVVPNGLDRDYWDAQVCWEETYNDTSHSGPPDRDLPDFKNGVQFHVPKAEPDPIEGVQFQAPKVTK